MSNKLLIISGPTASGKSRLAMQIAEKINGEIICADSITVYKGFNIGAAKPDKDDIAKIPHHLLDICNFDENYTAARFVEDADRAIEFIQQKNKIPIVVGGTGFYIRALLKGMAEQPKVDANKILEIRAELNNELEKNGNEYVYQKLISLDPNSQKTIKSNDTYRIIRAMEAMQITGKAWSVLNEEIKQKPLRYPSLALCLNLPKDELLKNILKRTQAMLQNGLISEVKELINLGCNLSHKPMQSIGYQQTYEWLMSPTSEKDLLDKISLATKQLVKRQLTWFRAEKLYPIQFIENLQQEILIDKIQQQLRN